MANTNELSQPVGEIVPDWRLPPAPERMSIEGRYCRLDPLSFDHAPGLFAAHRKDAIGATWTYLPVGPFADLESYRAWVEDAASSDDPLHFTISTPEHGPVGTASFLRINPAAGSIEVGFITYSTLLQRTRASTEAMFLMMRWAFDAGYRRYEWKCNALNIPSRAAALRLGLSYEGIFRQAQIVKGRNRDTAWYAAIDKEWPPIRTAMESWLDPANFSADGLQKASLSALTRPLLVSTDPAGL